MIIVKVIITIIALLALVLALVVLAGLISRPLREYVNRTYLKLKEQNDELNQERARLQSKYTQLVNSLEVPELLRYHLQLVTEMVSIKPVPWYWSWNIFKHWHRTAEIRAIEYMIREVSAAIKNRQQLTI